MKVNKVWCFFEQSGTFRDRFLELGIPSIDCDIQNEYGKTDIQIDLFNEIDNAYNGEESLFDDISCDDLVMSFFPCIRFTQQSELLFNQVANQYSYKSDYDKITSAMQLERERYDFFTIFCKMVQVCILRNIRLVIENPYSNYHYLVRYFPIKSKVIDFDRRTRGDYFKKPTQYWFINCEPSYNYDSLFRVQNIHAVSKKVSSCCTRVRSEISSEYAHQFIQEFIL